MKKEKNTKICPYKICETERGYSYLIAYIAPNERVLTEKMFADSIQDAIERFETKYPSCQNKVIAVTNLCGY